MKVTTDGFATMSSLLLQACPSPSSPPLAPHLTAQLEMQATDCPVAAALEGGYNAPVTSACCEAVLRVLLGEEATRPTAQFLSRATEPTLRAVVEAQRQWWPVLRGKVPEKASHKHAFGVRSTTRVRTRACINTYHFPHETSRRAMNDIYSHLQPTFAAPTNVYVHHT